MTELSRLKPIPRRVKLRVEDYLLLDEAGALDAYGKTELLDGAIVTMSPQHRPHAWLKTKLALRLQQRLDEIGSDLAMIIEVSAAMPPHNVPQPDIVLTSSPEGEGLVPDGSIALIVEVSDASLRTDLKKKAGIYARNGIPEYWVADVNARIVHQMAEPSGALYAQRREMRFAEPIMALTIPDLAVDIADVT